MIKLLTILIFVQTPFVDHFDRTDIPERVLTNPTLSVNYVPFIDSIIGYVEEDSIYSYIYRLQNFQTRYSFSDSIVSASQWIYDKFLSFGYDSVYFDSFPHPDNPASIQRNVVAVKLGDMDPDKVIVVGGHYDSVVYGGNPYVFAPGADDNASGTTGTLEMARVLGNVSTDKTIIFVTFAAEEQGLYGSQHFASLAYQNGVDIVFMLNLDMIGHEIGGPWNVTIESEAWVADYIDLLAEMAEIYTDSLVPEVYYSTYPYSDHWSFLELGYPAVFTIEGDFFSSLHTPYDLIDSLNMPYEKQVVQMGLATVLQISEMPSPPPSLSAENVGDGHSIVVYWTRSPEPDVAGYYLYWRQGTNQYTDTLFVQDTITTVSGLTTGVPAYFAVSSIDSLGFLSYLSDEVMEVPMALKERVVGSPSFFDVKVRPLTKTFEIELSLEEAMPITFKLYDATGRLKGKLDMGMKNRGIHKFLWRVKDLKNGIYFLVVKAGKVSHRKKLLYLN
jgi:hypothetical protein